MKRRIYWLLPNAEKARNTGTTLPSRRVSFCRGPRAAFLFSRSSTPHPQVCREGEALGISAFP